MKALGSLSNRIEEGHYYNDTKNNIQKGCDITMYYWSDRHCYYVTEVIDQKHIFVKEYEIMADKHKEGGMGHQNWLYFKNELDKQDYINRCVKEKILPDSMYQDLQTVKVSPSQEWVYRYNKWMRQETWTLDRFNKLVERTKSDIKIPEENMDKVIRLAQYYSKLSDNDMIKIKAGKTVKKYFNLNGKVSFGVKDYYFDWEF